MSRYLLDVVEALRELGHYKKSEDWGRRASQILVRDRDFDPISASVSAGKKLSQRAKDRWRPGLQLQAKLLLTRSLIKADLQKLRPAQRLGQEAALFAAAAEDPPLIADAEFRAGDVARRSRKTDQASSHFLRILTMAESDDQVRRTAAFASGALGQISMGEGRLQESLDRFDRAIDLVLLADPDDPVPAGIFYGDQAKVFYRRGNFLIARLEVEMALKSIAVRHPRCESYALRILGDVLVELGDRDQAKIAYDRAVDVARVIKNAHCLDMARVGRAWWSILFGEPSAALDDFTWSSDDDGDEDTGLKAEMLAGRALASSLVRDVSASDALATALSLAESPSTPTYAKAWVWACDAAVKLLRDEPDLAWRQVARSEEAFERVAPGLLGVPRRLIDRVNARSA